MIGEVVVTRSRGGVEGYTQVIIITTTTRVIWVAGWILVLSRWWGPGISVALDPGQVGGVGWFIH